MQEDNDKLRANMGKVIGPVRVHSARLPIACFHFYSSLGELDRSLVLPAELALLVRHQVSRLNVCSFCMDAQRAGAAMAFGNLAKFDALVEFRTDPAFSERERAALAYATELTETKHLEPETFARLARNFSEREICEIAYLVASEHLNNLTNLGLNVRSDMLCRVAPPGRKSAR